MTTMVVEVRGRDLPGRRCGPSPDGGSYKNIYVGIVRQADTIELVPGDAPSARWQLEVTVPKRRDRVVRPPYPGGVGRACAQLAPPEIPYGARTSWLPAVLRLLW